MAEVMSAAAEAITRGVAFLAGAQLASGEIPVETSTDPAMQGVGAPDPSVFPTAIAVQCLSHVAEAAAVVERARTFLCTEMDRHGLWRHWPRTHPHHAQLPPDMDDTACAAAALGDDAPNRRALLLANRRSDGLFLTWFVPRPRWTGARHLRATLPQLLHLRTLAMFFRRTSARPGDVDAVVNANALFHLGAFAGRERVVAHLLRVLRNGAEDRCDKWYEDPFVVRYFLSRALQAEPDARALIVARTEDAPRRTALHVALAITALGRCGVAAPEADVAHLLASQRPSGAWPRAALYHGGRQRLGNDRFAPPHPATPHWGSEALTTAFAVEALSRSLAEHAPDAAEGLL